MKVTLNDLVMVFFSGLGFSGALWLVYSMTEFLSFGDPGNNVCPKTFAMEEDWGRARVMKQRVDSDPKLQEAIDTCPVSCIHWSVTELT